jgi:1,2-phenylacetyl-CoA epoxidase PaaB subunit
MVKKEFGCYRIRGTPAQLLGSVEAPDAQAAIKNAIEEFKITDLATRNRIIVQGAK